MFQKKLVQAHKQKQSKILLQVSRQTVWSCQHDMLNQIDKLGQCDQLGQSDQLSQSDQLGQSA